jgi:hypothetical protein
LVEGLYLIVESAKEMEGLSISDSTASNATTNTTSLRTPADGGIAVGNIRVNITDKENDDDDDDCDDDDDDDNENDEYPENTGVQLGFVDSVPNDLFENSNWSEWDGGKIGGLPVSANKPSKFFV